MKRIRQQLTYANVLATVTIFLALGGATAIAAGQLGKNTVGSKQIKSNAVTAAKIKKNAITTVKIKDQAVTGAKIAPGTITGSQINVSTLGTVPSATTANGLANRTQFAFFMGAGSKDVYTAGPFVIRAVCKMNEAGLDEAELQILTTAPGSAVDTDGGDEESEFDPADNPLEINSDSIATGGRDIEDGAGSMLALGADGTILVGDNLSNAINAPTGHAGQCFFDGTLETLKQG